MHGPNKDETFEDLDFSRQAKSISGQISSLERAIIAHVRRASEENRDVEGTRRLCIDQVNRMIERLQ